MAEYELIKLTDLRDDGATRITLQGDTLLLVSENGKSYVITYDALRNQIIGSLPPVASSGLDLNNLPGPYYSDGEATAAGVPIVDAAGTNANAAAYRVVKGHKHGADYYTINQNRK